MSCEIDYDCPFCDVEFTPVEPWGSGACPNCGEEYYWDECCTEDYSDCWTSLYWKKHDSFWAKIARDRRN